MDDLDIAAILHKSVRNVVTLVTRTFFINIVSLITNLTLTVFLTPSIFGTYAIVLSIITVFTYFSDIGLASALIQKKEIPEHKDFVTTFTIQQVLVVTVCLMGFILTPILSKFFKLEGSATILLIALIISFFVSSLKTIPSVLLERKLQYDKLVIPDIVETLTFSVVVLFGAIKGLGVSSFTFAVLARGITGLISIYIVSPWKIELGFSKESAKKLFSFGIPFQLNSFLALLKDNLPIWYIGKVLPTAQVGYVTFAKKWAQTPLSLFSDNVLRILFPSYARIQHDSKYLGKAVEKTLFALTFLITPMVTGLVILAPIFVAIIPKYHKWEPALLSLVFFGFEAIISTLSTPLTNVLNAIGKVKITLYLMIMWTVMTWIIVPLSVFLFGFNGVSFAALIIAFTVFIVIAITKKYIAFSIKPVFAPLLSSILMGIVLYYLTTIFSKSLNTLLVLIPVGSLVYFGICFALARNILMQDIALIRKQFVK